LGLGINISVDEPANHALVLRVMLRGLGLEKLDALSAQRQRHLYAFLTKCQLGWRGKEVGDDPNLAKGFVGVPDLRFG
jgi:hypothetical protein